MRTIRIIRKGMASLTAVWLITAPVTSAFAAGEASLEDLNKRVEALEKASGGTPGLGNPSNSVVAGLGNPKLGLLLQLRYNHDETSTVFDSFTGRRAEISIDGAIVPKKVIYRVMIDPFIAKTTNPTIVQDAFIGLNYIPAADFTFGQFKFPQNLEGRWGSSDLDFARRAEITKAFGDLRDYTAQFGATKIPLGNAMTSAGPIWAEYALALVQGAGRNTAANRQHKDFAGRGGFQVGPVWMGANGYLGDEPTGSRTRVGTEFKVAEGHWKFQAEYLYGATEPGGVNAPATPGDSVAQEGYYALFNYRCGMLRPGIRWQSFDFNKNTPNNRNNWFTGGLDIFLAEGSKNKVTLNYTIKMEEGPAVKNNEGIVQYQIAF